MKKVCTSGLSPVGESRIRASALALESCGRVLLLQSHAVPLLASIAPDAIHRLLLLSKQTAYIVENGECY